MKYVFCVILMAAFFAPARADLLIDSELPSSRVADAGQFMAPPANAILADYLDTLAQTQKSEFYVVILKDVPVAQAAKLCDRWQEKWVPRGQGGVFVYSVPDKKYSFTPTPTTLQTIGEKKIQALFQSAIENPPLRQSLDVVIATPVLRIVSAIGKTQLEEWSNRAERGESQTSRWQVIAGMAGALALVGWLLFISRILATAGLDTFKSNIPPAGMAYRNPPRKSRGGRSGTGRRSGPGEESGRESRIKDRF